MNKKFHIKKIEINFLASILIISLFSVFITFIMFALFPKQDNSIYESICNAPYLFFLNYMPILFLMIFLYFLSNNCIFSVLLPSIFFIIIGLVNKIKILMRQDPFVPDDINLFNEAFNIFKNFDNSYKIGATFLIIVLIISILASFVFFKGKKMDKIFRIYCAVSTVVIFVSSYISIYSNEDLYNNFEVFGDYYFKVNQYNSKGFLYSFLHDFHKLGVEKPKNYDLAYYNKIQSEFKAQTNFNKNQMPNIIMIMDESYSDLSENKNFDFSNYIDPMANFKEIIREENSISGHIIVANFGGGTSDTEFDVLTACSSRFIGNSLPSYNFIKKEIDCIPNILKNIGYDTLAIHPGEPWFYNRQNVYNFMGFDDFLYLNKDFNLKTQSIANYISEEATFDKIIEKTDEHMKKNNNPIFVFCVTIQNHGPYESKYGIYQMNFDCDVSLNNYEHDLLGNYFKGIADADIQLQRFTQYYRNSEEPVILIYFGDHLPGFSNGMDFFDILDFNANINGTTRQRLNVYKTPFFIWQNEAAKNSTPIIENLEKIKLPRNMTISSNFLGSTFLQLLGINNVSPIFDYSNEIREKFPIVANQSFMDINCRYLNAIPEEYQEEIEILKGWTYYKVFDERSEK